MGNILELIGQGKGWSVTLVGMGAVFVSLILLVVFVKVFAAIIGLVEARRTAREEAPSASSPPVMEKPAPPPEVTPEIAAATAIALAADGRQEEIVAAVSYAVHNHLSAGEAVCTVPAAAGNEDGKGASPWSMAGRMRLMNGRMRWVNRGKRG